jgi:hypothetical protein
MSTWNIKGISTEARHVVKIMAAREGQSSGVWLEQLIRNKMTEQRQNQLITEQRQNQLKNLMKQLLQQAERQQQLQTEFQNRHDWLTDRLTRLKNQLDDWQAQKIAPEKSEEPLATIDHHNDAGLQFENHPAADATLAPPTEATDTLPQHEEGVRSFSHQEVAYDDSVIVTPSLPAPPFFTALLLSEPTNAKPEMATDADNPTPDSFSWSYDGEGGNPAPDPRTQDGHFSDWPNPTFFSETASGKFSLWKMVIQTIKTTTVLLIWMLLTAAMVYALSTGYLQQKLL